MRWEEGWKGVINSGGGREREGGKMEGREMGRELIDL